MATTLQAALPISQAQADEARRVTLATCSEFGVPATVDVEPHFDPDCPPYKLALIVTRPTVAVSDAVLRQLIAAVARELAAARLYWPDAPIESYVGAEW